MVHKSGEEVPDVHRGASFVSLKQAPSRFVYPSGLYFPMENPWSQAQRQKRVYRNMRFTL